MNKNKILVIVGATATGKTDLAIKLAKKFNGELISADSRQVYKGLDIGTGKFPSGKWKIEDGRWKEEKGYWEMDGIKIWMYDVVSPKTQYTVAEYIRDAKKVVRQVSKRGQLPIIVGGTGLYIKALLYGLSNLSIPLDRKLRQELEKLPLSKLQEKLKDVSPKKWESMNESDRKNPRRLIRSIELEVSQEKKQGKSDQGLVKEFTILKIGLTAPREMLYQRSDIRVVNRISMGMLEEAKRLQKQGLNLKRMKQLGLEYGILADYLDGKITSQEELIKILQGKIHGYIRRQLTWFKKEKDTNWFDIIKENFSSEVEKKVTRWYYQHHATQD